jgi:hypothetical protein
MGMRGGVWLDRILGPRADRQPSRAIAVLGMHRSGTSAITRGLAAMGVYLGNDFLDAQPENPTGYWEDRGIVELDERLLRTLGLAWDDAAPIAPQSFACRALRKLRHAAVRYVRRNFAQHALWGFKDPRTIRVLPFWQDVLGACRVDDAYLLVIRNPMSVAKSLFARQRMPLEAALRLWLAYSIPFFDRTAGKTMLVVDYDTLMLAPRRELDRIANGLEIAASRPQLAPEIERFSNEFLDQRLRHTVFTLEQIDVTTAAGRLARDAWALLFGLACDTGRPDAAFWAQWQSLARRYTSNIIEGGEGTGHG